MRPYQRHGASGRLAGCESELRDRIRVPDLLWQQPAGAGHADHRLQKGQRILALKEREVTAFTDQERPTSADTGTVIWSAILILAIAIAVVAVVDGSTRGVAAQDGFGDCEAVQNATVVG
jgi:hypothetical protein